MRADDKTIDNELDNCYHIIYVTSLNDNVIETLIMRGNEMQGNNLSTGMIRSKRPGA